MHSNVYGPQAAGFVMPTLAVLIQQEQAAMLVGRPSLTFLAGSPDLAEAENRAKLRRDDWLAMECVYNSLDLNNASGCSLEARGKALGYEKLATETDDEFKARVNAAESSISSGYISDLENELLKLNGVCRVRVYQPNEASVTGNGDCEIEVVVEGGIDTEIADVIWRCGNGMTFVGSTEVSFPDSDGICRTVSFSPATVTAKCIRVNVDVIPSISGCENQTFTTIQQAIFDAVTSKDRVSGIRIGSRIYDAVIKQSICGNISGIDIKRIQYADVLVDADGNCDCSAHLETAWKTGPLFLGPREIITLDSADCVCVIASDLPA